MKITPTVVFGFLAIFIMVFLLLASADKLLSLKDILEKTCPAPESGFSWGKCEFNLLYTKSLLISLIFGVPIFILYITKLMYKIYQGVGVYK